MVPTKRTVSQIFRSSLVERRSPAAARSGLSGLVFDQRAKPHCALRLAALVTEPHRLYSKWSSRLGPRGAGRAALIAISVIALDGARRPTWAQDATWLASPADENFNNPANWGPPPSGAVGPPTNTAFFSVPSSQMSPLVAAGDTSLNQIEFTSSATGYTMGVGFLGVATLTLNGDGVINSSPNRQGMVIGSDGTLIFNSGTAGANTLYTNLGGSIVFNNNSSGGEANFSNQNSGTITFNNSHAGAGEIDNLAGTVTFRNGSSADSALIVIGVTSPPSVGSVIFNDSNAGSASILIEPGSTLSFEGTSSGGQAAITNNDGLVDISALTNGGTTAGSIAGSGTFNLGANELTVGSLNLTTTVSGIIEGDGGSLTKVGIGTLILSGPNTYTGATTVAAGTLQAGAVNTLPMGTAVTVEAAGALALNNFDQSIGSLAGAGMVTLGAATLTTGNDTTTTIFSGVISGDGAVDKAGTGTFILTGGNIYTGGTTISAGTLQLGDGTTNGSILNDVVDDAGGTLAFKPAGGTMINFAGDISGAGAVSQIGAGTTILTGANTYMGGTTITAGTLQLGNGGATGSIEGDVVNNGNLAFDRSDAVTFMGLISGGGMVSQIGTGSTTLTEANTYSGGTLLSAGTLIAGNNSALGTGTLTVAANPSGTTLDNTPGATALANAIVLNPSANLTVAGSNPLALAGEISGDGALTKNGPSTLILTADNSYAGGTTINSGTLQVGNGGATGSVGTGPILDDSALVFNRSGTVTVPGAITGNGSLTQNGAAGGTVVLIGTNTYGGGTTISAGTLQLGDGGTTGSIIGNVANSGTLAFDRSDTATFSGVISGAGGVNQIGSGTTILAPATGPGGNTYRGVTTISAGTLQAGGVDAFSANSHTIVESGGTLDLHGFEQTLNNGLENAGTVNLGVPGITPPGTLLTVAGNYVGAGGTLNLNTFLGADGSASDQLVVNGGTASGSSFLHITNVGGPGEETTANGILVVNAINSATTAPSAFALANPELRAGAVDYDLFHGGLNGSDPNAWFLRSTFNSSEPESPTIPTTPPGPPILPPIAPPTPLPPGVAFPIIGPELATYGVVQPLARQLGLSILGTLNDRVGDTYAPDGCAVAPAAETPAVDLPTRKPAAAPTKKPGLAPCPLFSPSVWGRFFGQTLNTHYGAFADPRASGDLGGFQGGLDLLRGSLIAGQYERAGIYGAYGDVSADVTGLVTNAAATAYILTHTGSMNLNAWSGGAYWTHVGPGGWYLDTVLQGTSYGGSASTQFAKLDTDGWGFIASLEGGVPFALPQLGPGFVLEPQGQILWQKVSFRHDYDGLGDVALGDTTGPSGRIGLRAKWTVVTAGDQVWQPYVRANLWRDWGAEANTVYSGTDSVPLVSQITLLEVGGGVTGRINANVSVFANVDYEFAVGAANGEKQNGVRGAFGARYTW
jgi:outer membrane autotransporter protein